MFVHIFHPCIPGPRVGSETRLCIPDGVAVLAGLAVQETQLLERLAENVFAAHFCAEDYADREFVWTARTEYVRTGNK